MRFTAYLLLLSFLFVACTQSQKSTSTITESEDTFLFKAEYDEDKTLAVQQLINASLKPDRIFVDHITTLNNEIRLSDGSVFDLNSEPGELKIVLNKKKNSVSSLKRIETLSKKIEKIIEQK